MQSSGYNKKKGATNIKEFSKQLDAAVEQMLLQVQTLFIQLGEDTVAFVTDRPMPQSWFDESGNLRSSIGYVVARDGKVVKMGGFEQVLQGNEGVLKGKEQALRLSRRYSDNFVMVIVAGMDYADYVEAIEGKDVLESGKGYLKKRQSEKAREFNSQKLK